VLERAINQLQAVVGSHAGSVVSVATFCLAYSPEVERQRPQFDLIPPKFTSSLPLLPGPLAEVLTNYQEYPTSWWSAEAISAVRALWRPSVLGYHK
jgi:hypothetical protein